MRPITLVRPARTANRILAALPAAEYRMIRPLLERVVLEEGDVLRKPRARIRYVYFPESGVVCLINRLINGTVMEVGLIGREGAVGALSVLGTKAYAGEAIVQMPGSALRIRADILQSDATICPQLRALLMRFIQALFAQIVQSAACNGRHKIPERMARWLLMAHDRTDADVLPLSHELLAMMLGVRRPGVTHAMGALRKAGLIESRRGRITILNRAGLETAACECYQAVKDEYDRLLPRGR